MTRAKWLRKPSDLSPAALAVWRYYAVGLFDGGQLTAETAENFRLLCETLALVRAAAGEIAQRGVTIETAAGGRKPNPACSVLLQAQRQAASLLRDFGLT